MEIPSFGVPVPSATATHILFVCLFVCFPVLSEAQQKLLVKSMEKKILPVQLKLVRTNKQLSWEAVASPSRKVQI